MSTTFWGFTDVKVHRVLFHACVPIVPMIIIAKAALRS